jgi:hypothetical protein
MEKLTKAVEKKDDFLYRLHYSANDKN